MLEVLVASGVLLFGIAGVLQLMMLGLSQLRNADVREVSQVVVASTLAPFQALAYERIDAGGPSPLPDFVDDVGRTYQREVTVSEVGALDGGLRAYRVEVVVRWQQRTGAMQLNRESRGSALVSGVPDAGF
jgi:hypothetical protein